MVGVSMPNICYQSTQVLSFECKGISGFVRMPQRKFILASQATSIIHYKHIKLCRLNKKEILVS